MGNRLAVSLRQSLESSLNAAASSPTPTPTPRLSRYRRLLPLLLQYHVFSPSRTLSSFHSLYLFIAFQFCFIFLKFPFLVAVPWWPRSMAERLLRSSLHRWKSPSPNPNPNPNPKPRPISVCERRLPLPVSPRRQPRVPPRRLRRTLLQPNCLPPSPSPTTSQSLQ